MPELPEVETIVRELHRKLRGKEIHEVSCQYRPCIEHRSLEFFCSQAINQKVKGVSRRAKYICIELENGAIVSIHLRMTGKLLISHSIKDVRHLRLRITFSGNVSLLFIDVRKFGRIKFWDVGKPFLTNIGPEPDNIQIIKRILDHLKSIRPIKTILLDQKIIAGLGNIYADEALFHAGIYPLTPGRNLTEKEKRRLSHSIPTILEEAIGHKGTTLSDYRTTSDKHGKQQGYLMVYGRKELPCHRCQTPIQRLRINSRSTYFCPKCQT